MATLEHLATVAAKNSSQLQKHGCVIFIPQKRIYITGFNYETSQTRKFTTIHKSIHAEEDTCRRVYPRHLLAGSIMYVVRLTRSGQSVHTTPCQRCMKMITKFGIGKIYYKCKTVQ